MRNRFLEISRQRKRSQTWLLKLNFLTPRRWSGCSSSVWSRRWRLTTRATPSPCSWAPSLPWWASAAASAGTRAGGTDSCDESKTLLRSCASPDLLPPSTALMPPPSPPARARLCVTSPRTFWRKVRGEAADKKRALWELMRNHVDSVGGGIIWEVPKPGTVTCCTAEIKDQTQLPSIWKDCCSYSPLIKTLAVHTTHILHCLKRSLWFPAVFMSATLHTQHCHCLRHNNITSVLDGKEWSCFSALFADEMCDCGPVENKLICLMVFTARGHEMWMICCIILLPFAQLSCRKCAEGFHEQVWRSHLRAVTPVPAICAQM